MHYLLTTTLPTQQESDCLILPVLANHRLSESGMLLDKATQGQLMRVIQADLTAEFGDRVLLHDPCGVKAKRILAVSLGKQTMLSDTQFQTLMQTVAHSLKARRLLTICCYLDEFPLENDRLAWKVGCAVREFASSVYVFETYKTKKQATPSLTDVAFYTTCATPEKAIHQAIQQGLATAAGMMLTRRLADTPANQATPSDIADDAIQLAESDPCLKARVYDTTDEIIKEMGAFKAVAQGSDEPAKFVVIEYQPPERLSDSPIVLVGKGVTFDAGGISIKPSKDMGEMKFDMAGAASVLGSIKALSMLKVGVKLVGLLPLTENLLNGSALKPGDVINTLSGKTVEVLDTDAEGRLILADALTYSRRFNPAVVIDVATLTGAIVVALGEITTGLMTTDPALGEALKVASEKSVDRVWPLPLFKEYQALIDSNVADIANLGYKGAGSITAGCFLAQFTEGLRWAHLDIAGTAYLSGRNKAATGRPVPLLVQYVLDYCAALKASTPSIG